MIIHLKRYFSIGFFLVSFLFLNSCVSKSKINYFQDKVLTDTISKEVYRTSYTLYLKKDDLLKIDISSMDMESLKPFLAQNLNPINQVPSYSNGIAAYSGYLIDSDGNINLPIIGKLKLEGLSKMEAVELIRAKLSDYITDPIINITIQNFKVTILGDVKNPGSYNIPNDRITIPEILGIAGDLNITGIRKNILVLRDIDGIKKEFRIDLTSKDVFNSEAYYLRQNDVIYVEPNRAKRNSSLISSTAGIFISVASLIITTINVITK